MQHEHLMPVQEFAELYNVHVSTVNRWIDLGHIPVIEAPGPHRRVYRYIPLERAEENIRKNARITWRTSGDRRVKQ